MRIGERPGLINACGVDIGEVKGVGEVGERPVSVLKSSRPL